MFCINHKQCGRVTDNGNCTTYNAPGVVAINTAHRPCPFLALAIESNTPQSKLRVGQQKQKKAKK